MQAPLSASQTRAVWSLEADATRVPSGEKRTPFTSARCPTSFCCGRPAALQSSTVAS
jgi:hypothetical protein